MPTRYRVVLLVGVVLAIVVSVLAWDGWRERQMRRTVMEQIVLNRYVDVMLRAAYEQGLGGGEVVEVREDWPEVSGVVLGESDVVKLLSQVDESVRHPGPETVRLENALWRGTWIVSLPNESGLIGVWIPPADTRYNAVEVPAEGLPRERR